VVAFQVAQRLGAPLDLTIPRKLGAPANPELAIGAVSQDGNVVLNDDLVSYLRVPKSFIDSEVRAQLNEIERRMVRYRPHGKPLPNLHGKVVIVVDDGIATGATMRAALQSIKKQAPKKLIVAIPVGPADTIEWLKKEADEVVCLEIPPFFNAIGEFYEDFRQTEDAEVVELLSHASS
jgi:predicted phosphoribosyltransferase